jgi:hypothetical protein
MEDYKTLISVAETATGLKEFGGDSYREGLERLVTSLNQEAQLNPLGETFLRDTLLKHLKQRLQVEDWYRRHPEIDGVEILPPLFGVSLPRTGSTALSFLLASDPEIRYLRAWESAAPCPPPSTVSGDDPRRKAAGDAVKQGGQPKSHTPTGIDGPMECLDLMALDFKSNMFSAFAMTPSYSDWLMDVNMESTYRYQRRVMKLLQWGEPTRPWRLKSPAHLLHLADLDTVFPNARFVMTHRDPTEVMLSIATVYADIADNFTDALDRHYLGDLNVKLWSEGMRRAIGFRDAGNDPRFYDIHFKAMHRDPVGQIEGLYQWLGEPILPAFRTNMEAWWAENTENHQPVDKPDPATFGIDLEEVSSLFADYRSRMAAWTSSSV